MNSRSVQVAVGIIFHNEANSVLLCQRTKDKPYPLKWEFPGGKLEKGETTGACLKRELREELSIDAEIGELYHRQHNLYPDSGTYDVFYYLVRSFTGVIVNQVFEDIRWAPIAEIDRYDILEGNAEVVEKLVREKLHR